MGFFYGQNFELGYINIVLNKLLLCVITQKAKITKINLIRDTSILNDVDRYCIAYIAFLNHSCVTVYNCKRCSIKPKDEEVEIEVMGSRSARRRGQ